MAGFRRPELEKDNPIAPQPYVGPRRRLAMARAAAVGKLGEAGDMKETLQVLTEAAARFVKSQPKEKKTDKHLSDLQRAIMQAERWLEADR